MVTATTPCDGDRDGNSARSSARRAGYGNEAGVVGRVASDVGQTTKQADARPADNMNPGSAEGTAGDPAWDANDWEQPASVFRPDYRTESVNPDLDCGLEPNCDHDAKPEPDPPDQTSGGVTRRQPLPSNGSRVRTYPPGQARIIPCPGGGQPRPLPVTIGIIVTAQSLFGFSNMPGQLMDRSATIPANRIRELAHQPGTLFHRLITDEQGNLLDITELGRFPSRKLAIAVKLRDGTCTGPTCTTPATRCDIDHLTPVPDGQTTAENLNDKCRHEHRAKTHAGHQTTRTGPHRTEWTTPTGHKYPTTDMPFPTEQWPTDEDRSSDKQATDKQSTDHLANR